MAESATKAMMMIASPRIPNKVVQDSVRNMKRFTVPMDALWLKPVVSLRNLLPPAARRAVAVEAPDIRI